MNALIAKSSQQIGVEKGDMPLICLPFIFKRMAISTIKLIYLTLNVTIRLNLAKCGKYSTRSGIQNSATTNQLVKFEKKSIKYD